MPVSKFIDEVTGGEVAVNGSDKRSNTSARTDGRLYYNSRDESQTYSLVFDDAACSAGDFNCSLFNDRKDGYDLIIHAVGLNASAVSSFKLHEVTGSEAGGGRVTATPYRLNRSRSNNSATVTACSVVNSDSDPITGLISIGVIDHAGVSAGGHEQFRLDDGLRIGQDQGIAVEMDSGANGTRAFGVIFFYFEKQKN